MRFMLSFAYFNEIYFYFLTIFFIISQCYDTLSCHPLKVYHKKLSLKNEMTPEKIVYLTIAKFDVEFSSFFIYFSLTLMV